MLLIDTHAHLDAESLDADRAEVLIRARSSGVEQVVCPGLSAASSHAVVRLAESYPGVYAAVGIQPNSAGEAAEGDLERVEQLIDHPRVVALGETGLDRHWDFTPIEVQQEYFDRHLRLAQQHDLPVVIHCREAEADVLAMLEEAVGRGPLAGVIHAFSGEPAFAQACLGLGLYVSFAGQVTYTNRKFQALRQMATRVPDDRLLIETDSPYLVPHPLRGKKKRNEPAHLIHTVGCLAELRGQSREELAGRTSANAQRLFRLA
jgi:TatD DNase family protein